MCRKLVPSDKTRALRDALGQFATGVAAVTTLVDGRRPVGMTINSFTSISLAPPLVAWCLDRQAASYLAFARAPRFCISMLSADQASLARRFSRRGADKFADIPVGDEAPVIEGACAYFRCEAYKRVSLGDHLMLVGKVIDFDKRCSAPLIFARGELLPLPVRSVDEIAA